MMVNYGASKYGIGVSPDSVGYISTAQSLLNRTGFYLFNNEPFVHWPPLYPILLAALGLLGINPLVGAKLFNMIAFGFTIFSSGFLLLKVIESSVLFFWAVLSFIFSEPLLEVSVMAWSEPIYIFLSVLFFLVFSGYLKQEKAQKLLLCSAIAALVCLQRYVGVILVATGALSIPLFAQNSQIMRRARNALIFTTIALLPTIMWGGYNFSRAGTFAGHRNPAYWGALRHLSDLVTVISGWFIPLSVPFVLNFFVLLACVVALALIIKRQQYRLRRLRPIESTWNCTVKPLIIYIALYSVFIIFISSYTANEPIGNRLLSPLYPFLMIVLSFCIDGIYKSVTFKKGYLLKFVISSILFLWLLYPIYGAVSFIKLCRQEGAGEDFYRQSYYGKDAWQKSPLIQWLRNKHIEEKVYSNEPYALYILTGIVASYSPITTVPLSQFVSTLPNYNKCLLIWFNEMFNGKKRFFMQTEQLYPLDLLKNFFKMEEVVIFEDGSIYKFSKLNLTN